MSQENQSFDLRFHGCELVLSPTEKGINDASALRSMSREVDQLLAQPRPNLITDVVVHFGQVGFISSIGLNELIHLKQCADRCGVAVKLRSIPETVRKVFQITRLERVFELEDDGSVMPIGNDEPRSV